eukprot:CAMPEP_0119040878 /NCGR_PEP_ID=MMETSP1177-20130426/10928_1 /TAXON_ID=2985 /ORGANISM="Ochromonas sp, Strain CCMP1899" /LENGTH=530 /DNA_ID=CAMNT_0007006361 /DNA_START=43 /DNA_END=1635 /DNA_ORIENTATION=-
MAFSAVKICSVIVYFLLQKLSIAEIIPYFQHEIIPLHPEYLTIPKFSPKDAPNWAPGHGHSYIDLSRVKIDFNCDAGATCPNVNFEVLMFEEPKEKPWMEYWPNKQFCCTNDMVTAGDCFPEQMNKLIVPLELPGAFLRSVAVVSGVPKTLSEDGTVAHHEISKSGVYVLFMGICDPKSAPVSISGSINSLDPYGYLPADLFGNLPFYGALSIVYGVVGVIWLVYCIIYSDNLMAIQGWITTVLALGMIETAILFQHYLSWNDFGYPAPAVTFLALLFGVMKRTVSRMVVLLVALGYGVVRPTLGEDMRKVIYLGCAYFFLSLTYTVISSLPQSNRKADDSEYDLISLTVFILAGIDTTFYIWIFSSVHNLLISLALRKQASKYILYRNFRNVLSISFVSTCIWMLYGSVINLDNGTGEDNNWKDHWTVDALWELTYFMIFVAIAIMWAPSVNMQKYAYSIELSTLDEDEEWAAAGLGTAPVFGAPPGEGGQSPEGDTDDAEYGGRLDDENDPFQGSGALDPLMAAAKKQ